MRKEKLSNLKRRMRRKRSNGRTVISPKQFIIGRIDSPTRIDFDAEALNVGIVDASLFKTAITRNKLDKHNHPGVNRAVSNFDPESPMTAFQQGKNSMAVSLLSDLGVTFIETPTSLLDDMNKDEDAGMIPSDKYLGTNTLFTTNDLLNISARDKKASVITEIENTVDISAVTTNIIDSIFSKVFYSSDNDIEIFGKARR
tara:strand:- start:1078 stop:1677 length:600 start_codon:yes stop_codon:yes gene_type:complete